MRILVVCGAGASSTFVAQRVRHAAQAAGRELSAVAGTEQSLPIDIDAADVVLVGSHLQNSLDRIRRAASTRLARVVLLPADIHTDINGTRTLALVDQALSTEPEPPTPTERNPV